MRKWLVKFDAAFRSKCIRRFTTSRRTRSSQILIAWSCGARKTLRISAMPGGQTIIVQKQVRGYAASQRVGRKTTKSHRIATRRSRRAFERWKPRSAFQNNKPKHLVGVSMNKAGMAFCKLGVGILVMTSACVSSAKTPIDQTLDFLVGPKMGGSRTFKCREAVNEKVTDEHVFYEFRDDGYYSRLGSHPDPRAGFPQPLNVKGTFRVKMVNELLIITFRDEFANEVYLNDQRPYDAVLIGTDNNDTMAMMMDRPLPRKTEVRDRLRLVCIGNKPSGGGPQRSY
nr:hypothetical protein HUO10_001498 [Paraburkholderia busanensis]